MVRIHVSPRDAYGGQHIYVKGEQYEEPWYISMFFDAISIIKAILDFMEKMPTPISAALDAIFDIRSGAYGSVSVEDTPTGKRITWLSGHAERYRYVGIKLATDREKTRTITVEEVGYHFTDQYQLIYVYQSTTIPGMKFADFSRNEWQLFRHWAHKVRLDVETPLRIN